LAVRLEVVYARKTIEHGLVGSCGGAMPASFHLRLVLRRSFRI